MMPPAPLFLAVLILAAYLAGSIPNGLLIAACRGVDLRKTGSGNIGATNVFRCVGKAWGVAAFVLDALKGFVPAFFFPRLMEAAPPWLGLACGAAAVAGHTWPVWLGFKGGKGVSTSAGMLLGIAPPAAGIGFAVFAIVVMATRWVSLSSILAAIAVPAAGAWFYGKDNPLLAWALAVIGLLVVVKHRSNIRRLLNGTEPRIVGRNRPSR